MTLEKDCGSRMEQSKRGSSAQRRRGDGCGKLRGAFKRNDARFGGGSACRARLRVSDRREREVNKRGEAINFRESREPASETAQLLEWPSRPGGRD